MGLIAAAIPLVIHLWSRRQAVTVDFSSLMFLVAAHRQNVRRFQLKQLLILLLRMLIIALIALALARPFLTLGLPLTAVRARTDVVIVLDNSYSMGYQDVDGVWFDKAKKLATDVLSSLRYGDSVSLILMSDIPQPIFPKLTPDIEGVMTAIQESEVSSRGTNILPSLDLAHEILSESDQKNRELYIISDFAQHGWENFEIHPNRSGSRIILLPIKEGISHNTNIEEIHPSHQLIGIDLPFHLNISINNHSLSPVDQTTLTLYIDDKKLQNKTLSLDTDESLMTTLTHIYSAPGIRKGYLELTADRLNIDNRRYFVLEALGEIRVLCVSDQTEYLQLALNPLIVKQTEQVSLKTSMIQPTTCTPEEFETYPLEEFDVLLLADFTNFSNQTELQLQEFIRQGKHVIVFISVDHNLSWSPAQFGDYIDWQVPQQISKYNESHPIFEIFTNNVLSGQYGPIFYEALRVTPTEDATVIAGFEDDTPFLIERRAGNSRILFFNCGFDQESGNSDLLVNPYFLPLLQQTVLYVMGSETRNNLIVGESYRANFPQNTGGVAWIKTPGSTDEDTLIAVPIDEDGSLQFDDTETPGIYQVDVRSQDSLFRYFFAVNTQVSEANLDPISLEQAAQRVNAHPGITNADGNLDTETLDIRRHGREIWAELLIFAVCLLLLEGYLSNRHSTVTTGEV